ncbi:sister chromatid cohesion 1 protein 1-like [Hordeum vulgare]|nr:sister chromatid cohesion 1 protein 1-like [Hordeum vulgare]
MFYSHQLLSWKAPLGQIWFAATLKAKINRRRLDKLDIIKICEETLNPPVPRALRPSRILMGELPLRDYYLAAFLAGFALPSYSSGVVIVYKKKVKILYDDVSCLLANLELKVCSAFY